MPKLSIIVLSYNTLSITAQCLQSLIQNLASQINYTFEIIVVDNASSDGSQEMLQNVKQNLEPKNVEIKLILNTVNEGFPKGNNTGVAVATGEFLLFLNSDVILKEVIWSDLFSFFDKNDTVGALTVKVMLSDNRIDPASHRGFPTVWRSLSYYLGLEKLTKHIPVLNTLFGGYHLTHLDLQTIHDIDSPSGAFYLMRKSLFEEIGRFDETFFMYGEDIDLSFRIKAKGYRIVFYPSFTVLHLKYQSGLKKDHTSTVSKTKEYFYDAMIIFYKKHYVASYPYLINMMVYSGIRILRKLKS